MPTVRETSAAVANIPPHGAAAPYTLPKVSINVSQTHASNYDLGEEQAWYSSDGWQLGEQEADADIAAGSLYYYQSGEDFLNSIREIIRGS